MIQWHSVRFKIFTIYIVGFSSGVDINYIVERPPCNPGHSNISIHVLMMAVSNIHSYEGGDQPSA